MEEEKLVRGGAFEEVLTEFSFYPICASAQAERFIPPYRSCLCTSQAN